MFAAYGVLLMVASLSLLASAAPSKEASAKAAYLKAAKASPHQVERRDVASHTGRSRREIDLIYPGTKWCGKGNKASSYDDLGEQKNTDSCCRTHDHCPYSIAADETKYSLHNTEDYTISHCSCDQSFLTCLKGVRGEDAASTVGIIYFNSLNAPCFKFGYHFCCRYTFSGWSFRCARYCSGWARLYNYLDY